MKVKESKTFNTFRVLLILIAITIAVFICKDIIKNRIVDSDPVFTRASIMHIETEVSSGRVNSRYNEDRRAFSGHVEVEYSYEFEKKIYSFKETFSYTHMLDILAKSKQKEVRLDLEDMQYLPIVHSRKYPSLHYIR